MAVACDKGINVANVLKDLGIDVTVGSFLGKDNKMASSCCLAIWELLIVSR